MPTDELTTRIDRLERKAFTDKTRRAEVCRCEPPRPDREQDGDVMCGKCGLRCGYVFGVEAPLSPMMQGLAHEIAREIVAAPGFAAKVAENVLVRLPPPPAAPAEQSTDLLTTKQVAFAFGCSTDTIYRHKDQLGVIRLGNGPRPRLRFPPDCVSNRSIVTRGKG